jgi:hypothetical protein
MYGEAPMSKIAIAAVSILLLLCGSRPGPADAATTSHAAEKNRVRLRLPTPGSKLLTAAITTKAGNRPAASSRIACPRINGRRRLDRHGRCGSVVSRKVKSAKYMTSVPGAPDAQYVVIQYQTSFVHKKSATETVTSMLDSDGNWRVSGYYIR